MENTQPTASSAAKTYHGGCHCGRVRFEARIDLGAGTNKCNCSICKKAAFWGAIVKPTAFKLLSGEDSLRDYQFNSKSVHHVFCQHCGVRSFGHGVIEQIGGAYYSINLNCLEDADEDLRDVPIKHFNGRDNDWS